jgi:hypothetical protein
MNECIPSDARAPSGLDVEAFSEPRIEASLTIFAAL